MWDMNEVETWLAAWDSQGVHSTATPGDEAGADWLSGAAEALGATVTVERFALDRIDPIEASVSFEGTTIEGVALFDAPDGTAEGKAGPIGQTEATIGVGEVDPRAVYSGDFRAMREAARHRALVLATVGEAPGSCAAQCRVVSCAVRPADPAGGERTRPGTRRCRATRCRSAGDDPDGPSPGRGAQRGCNRARTWRRRGALGSHDAAVELVDLDGGGSKRCPPCATGQNLVSGTGPPAFGS
jgi:hypothetical protein